MMPAPISPLVVAQSVARHLAPVAGILFLGWSASSTLLLYFADTVFSIAVIMSGLLRHFSPPPDGGGWADRVNGEAGAVIGGTLLAAVFAVPLGVPLFFMLGHDFSWREALADSSLRSGMLWQAVAAWWSYLGLYRALAERAPDELRLKRRFGLVFVRWIALVSVAATGVGSLLGGWGALGFVAVYAALSVFAEIAPDRLLQALPAGAAFADDGPANGPAEAGSRSRRRRRR